MVGQLVKITQTALLRYLYNHGVALASNIAFSLLLALFPFLLLMTATTIWWGGDTLRLAMVDGLFAIFPKAIARILEPEVHAVVDQPTASLLSFGAIVLLVTLTGAIESLREGLNRAYGQRDRRSLVNRRLGGLVFLLGSAGVLAFVALALVAAPLAWAVARPYLPALAEFDVWFRVLRFGLAGFVLLVFLIACHRHLPVKPLPVRSIIPGVMLTLVLWVLAGAGYSYYLTNFAGYARVYAGLAGVVATMIFFHLIASILLIGAEFNAALSRKAQGSSG